jgi:hypothetical protein
LNLSQQFWDPPLYDVTLPSLARPYDPKVSEKWIVDAFEAVRKAVIPSLPLFIRTYFINFIVIFLK